jgi:hypothetical protein
MDNDRKVLRKIEREKQIVCDMIAIYCRHHHYSKTLCDDCQALADYASKRSDHCPYKQNKTFCSQCTTHCYAPAMREKIRQVMRYAGPRMIFYHPLAALRHLYHTKLKH